MSHFVPTLVGTGPFRVALLGSSDGSRPAGPEHGDGLLVRLFRDPDAFRRALTNSLGSFVDRVLPVALPVVVLAAAVALGLWLARRADRRASERGARTVEILAPPEPESGGAAALWANLHDLLGHRRRAPWRCRPRVAFEYVWNDEGLRVQMWLPGNVPAGLIERAVEAAWPGARTTTTESTKAPLPEEWRFTGGELRLAAPAWFPLHTDLEPDPLRAVLGAGACDPGQAAVAQLVLRPLPGRAARRFLRAARDLRNGRPSGAFARIVDLVGPTAPPRPATDPSANPDIKLILDKAKQRLWCGVVRYGTASEGGDRGSRRFRRGHAHGLASAFGVFGSRNSLVRRRLRGGRGALASRRLARGDLLSTSEVAALAHLPLDRIVPALARAGARPVAPPPAVSREPMTGLTLGESDAGPRRPVVLRSDDARYHVHVMGATGSGKSTLLTSLVAQDVGACRGVVVIDPNGDLIRDIHGALDEKSRARAVLLDPQAEGRPPTLNMLEVPDGVAPDLVVDNLVGILGRIFESSWGPRIEDILRSACLTLLRKPGATLSDIPTILTLRGEYQRYLEGLPNDDPLRGFWAWYEAQSAGQRAAVTGPLLYKLRHFLLRPFVRQVVNSPTSSIDLGRILDGGLLLVRVPKGVLGEDTAKLLGSFVVAKTWQAASARAALPLEARRDARLVIDECQNFLNLPRSFDEISAEARKYRLALLLAHQVLAQLPRTLAEGLSANMRNKVIFRTSPEDARVLERHMLPNLTAHDLANLAAYQAAVRLMCDAQEQPAFTLGTVLPKAAA